MGILSVFVMTSIMAGVSLACNKGHVGGGWGQPEPLIIFPKPTLIPKLKQAFYEGKKSVDYWKIVGPSLKPLPYKKGVGFIGVGNNKGWGGGANQIGGGFNNYGYNPGKSVYVGVKGQTGHGQGGWGQTVSRPVGPPVILTSPKGGWSSTGPSGPVGPSAPVGPIANGPYYGSGAKGAIYHPASQAVSVTPVVPHVTRLTAPVIHPHGVSHQSVTLLQKGYPQPNFPLDPHVYGK